MMEVLSLHECRKLQLAANQEDATVLAQDSWAWKCAQRELKIL